MPPPPADLALRWNKPKAGTYHDLCILYLDEAGHCQVEGISAWGWPEHFAKFKASFLDQLDETQKHRLAILEKVSRSCSPVSWKEWEDKQGQ